MSEFSFIDNTGWLKPFIIELHKYYKCSTVSIEKLSPLFEESEEGEEEVTNMVPESSADTRDNAIFTNTSVSFHDAN